MSDHLKGLLITVIGVLVLSPDTLLIRLAGIEPWSLLVYRGHGTPVFRLVQQNIPGGAA